MKECLLEISEDTLGKKKQHFTNDKSEAKLTSNYIATTYFCQSNNAWVARYGRLGLTDILEASCSSARCFYGNLCWWFNFHFTAEELVGKECKEMCY